ncbi:DNA adenine methylase [Halobacteriaceae archaeon GCM10025711]
MVVPGCATKQITPRHRDRQPNQHTLVPRKKHPLQSTLRHRPDHPMGGAITVPAVFPFPGGKSRLSSWILEHVPANHTCFVEVFGGAAGVLFNKDPAVSTVEVYNDRDEDLVQFFRVLREQPDELVAWLDAVPFARAVHDHWADRYYNGYRASDPIARAGQFFFLRYSQFGAGYESKNGFGTSKVRSRALSFANKKDRLQKFADRFRDVIIENLDWVAVIEKYDGPETVFYLDPPYLGTEDYYPVHDIDHAELIGALETIDGRFVLSYQDLPNGLEDYNVVAKGSNNFIGNGLTGSANETTEHLVMNFDPTSVEAVG